ncbi:MAG: PP2C family serine/threonine-protein phosphatase [Romboutsia timonensis]|uniref:PP2C family protein-serine/threonine phosphatase n=1 Tax=Romboutsia timonensis TaxID=1776391 RepID=UPI002A75533C|nr:PP2C family serine/threonine-protein phosphatase [Romboutsia timonensis]MDY2883504.1 PP2C family serine/threonine-protein phosphatase [Romboutsia timonensis]
MEFLISYYTDKGIKKRTNQDGLMMKSIRTNKGRIGLFAVCDGMGGLDKGELASSTVITQLSKWFDEELPSLITKEDLEIVNLLNEYIYKVNKAIVSYSIENNIKIGTTLTALLCIYDKYYIIQVGDSRVYEINNTMEILTKDQTYVAREVERGNITKEQAKTHPKRNILLQCIGAKEKVETVITSGYLEKDTTYVICSDGLYHQISDDEFVQIFNPKINITEKKLEETAKNAVKLVMDRRETDNITVLIVRTK